MKKTPLSQDVFFQYPVNQFKTSAGDIDLPIFYHDSSLCMAIFMVDLERTRSFVTDERLEIVRFSGNKAMVAITFYEYRATTIGSYNEVAVAITVKPRGTASPLLPLLALLGPLDKNPMGAYLIDLPVTTEAACAAGKEVWGLPKFVTDIDFKLQGNNFHGRIGSSEKDGPIFTLEGKGGFGGTGPLLDLPIYSIRQGSLLRALVNTRGGCKYMLGGSVRVRINRQSTHPMSQRLAGLGLDNAKPRFIMASHRLQLRLNAGAYVTSTGG